MLSKLPLRITYRSASEDLISEFYVPCLENSVLYRRAVGYFTSAGLAFAARGVASLIERGGRMLLVASPALEESDLEALRMASEQPEEVLRRVAMRGWTDVADLLSRERLNALAWLIAKGCLEVRLAVRLNAAGGFARGIYHEKMGIFSDAEGNHVAFSGSSNETAGGLVDNFESIDVYWSWDDPQGRVQRKIDDFTALWAKKTNGVRIYEFTEISAELLAQYKRPDPPDLDSSMREDPPPNGSLSGPSIPSWCQLRPYQEAGAKKWIEAGGKGILAMATGTGKTLTALVLAMRVAAKNQPMLLVIVCPYINLAEQWVRELEQFRIPATRCYHSTDEWRVEAQDASQRLQSRLDRVRAFVVTNKTFLRTEFQACLRPEAFHHFLIADEVHNLGAEHASSVLPGGIRLRLGLSATPKRHMDDAGTRRILDFFGGVVYEFGIKEALNTPLGDGSDRTVLCPYEYHPIVVGLDDDEADAYADLTARLVRCLNPDADGETSDSAKRLLIARARLLAGARQKLPALDKLLSGLPARPKKAIFYCGDGTTEDLISQDDARQIDAVTRLVGERHDLKVQTFTYREASSEREAILTALRDGRLDGVVAIRCLDEGIDVPDLRMGFLLASSTNPRQFVQRRGRLLRTGPGKDRAVIYDFIIRPPQFDSSSETAAYNMERSMFKRELARIVEFCDTAVNGAQALNSLMQLRIDYGLLAQ